MSSKRSLRDLLVIDTVGRAQCIVCASFHHLQSGKFGIHIKKEHGLTPCSYFLEFYAMADDAFCACGCGLRVTWNVSYAGFNDFIGNHRVQHSCYHPTLRRKLLHGDRISSVTCAICSASIESSYALFKHHIALHSTTPQLYYLEFIDPAGNVCLCGCGEKTAWHEKNGGYFRSYKKDHMISSWAGQTVATSGVVAKRTATANNTRAQWTDEFREKYGRTISKTITELYTSGKLESPFAKMDADARAACDAAAQRARNKLVSGKHRFGKFETGFFSSLKTGEQIIYQSSYERQRLEQLDGDAEVLSFGRCDDMIPYTDTSGKHRQYNPDFLVLLCDGSTRVEETKGYVLENDALKIKAAAHYYGERNTGYIVLSKNDQASEHFIDITESMIAAEHHSDASDSQIISCDAVG